MSLQLGIEEVAAVATPVLPLLQGNRLAESSLWLTGITAQLAGSVWWLVTVFAEES